MNTDLGKPWESNLDGAKNSSLGVQSKVGNRTWWTKPERSPIPAITPLIHDGQVVICCLLRDAVHSRAKRSKYNITDKRLTWLTIVHNLITYFNCEPDWISGVAFLDYNYLNFNPTIYCNSYGPISQSTSKLVSKFADNSIVLPHSQDVALPSLIACAFHCNCHANFIFLLNGSGSIFHIKMNNIDVFP